MNCPVVCVVPLNWITCGDAYLQTSLNHGQLDKYIYVTGCGLGLIALVHEILATDTLMQVDSLGQRNSRGRHGLWSCSSLFVEVPWSALLLTWIVAKEIDISSNESDTAFVFFLIERRRIVAIMQIAPSDILCPTFLEQILGEIAGGTRAHYARREVDEETLEPSDVVPINLLSPIIFKLVTLLNSVLSISDSFPPPSWRYTLAVQSSRGTGVSCQRLGAHQNGLYLHCELRYCPVHGRSCSFLRARRFSLKRRKSRIWMEYPALGFACLEAELFISAPGGIRADSSLMGSRSRVISVNRCENDEI
ncbi:hypothetical protein Tco_1439730 [Tanacetum coccineum]